MRVAYLNLESGLGGAERVLLDLIAALPQVAPEIEPHVIALADGPLLERLQVLGARVHLVPMPRSSATLGDSALYAGPALRRYGEFFAHGLRALLPLQHYVRALHDSLAQLQPDLIHSNNNKTNVLTHLVGLREVPVVWHLHDFLRPKPLTAACLRWASRRASHVIANSSAVARDALQVLPHVPIEAIHNGVDLAEFSPGAAEPTRLDTLARLPPAPEGTVRVGLVSTYARWKGQTVFFDTITRLASDPLLRFYLIGGPIYRTVGSQFTIEELKKEAEERGISDRLGFVEFQPEVAPFYRALDIVVHASTEPEPFGRTIVEAMACGAAVVSTIFGGSRELFLPGVEGLGVPPADAERLAEAIRLLAFNPEKRRELGMRARRAAVERFSRERFAGRVVEAYRRLRPWVKPAESRKAAP